jgi:hypothetical protein
MQCLRRENIYRHAEKSAQLVANLSDVKDGRLRRGIDQNIEVALLGILPIENRPEDSGIPGASRFNDAANLLPM